MDKACLEMERVGNITASDGREKGQGKGGGQSNGKRVVLRAGL